MKYLLEIYRNHAFKTILFAAMLAVLTGCKDEEVGYHQGLIDQSRDLTEGMNVMYIDINEPTPHIRLNAEEPVYAIPQGNAHGIIAVIERGEGLQYLRLFPPLEEGTPQLDNNGNPINATPLKFPFTCEYKIKVDSDDKLTKSLFVIFRDRTTEGTGTAASTDPAAALGCGMDITGDVAGVNRLARLLDYTLLFDNSSYQLGEVFVPENLDASGTHEVSGGRYQAASGEMAGLLGAANFQTLRTKNNRKYAFSHAFDLVMGSAKTDHNYYEYYANYYTKEMLGVSLTNIVTASSATLLAFMDSTVNLTLNNPTHPSYADYSNDKEGIFKLLDHFGTHVMTQGIFGGRHMYIYAREENAYRYSVDVSAGGNLTNVFSGAQAVSYITDANAAKLKDAAESKLLDTDVEQVTNGIWAAAATGGNADATNFAAWKSSINSDNPEGFAMVSYKGKDNKKGGLIDITQLIVDKARKEVVVAYLDEYIESKINGKSESAMILADVYMKTGADGHLAADPKPFVATGPDGTTKLLYNPIIANRNAPVDNDYALETSQTPYITAAGAATDQYWYYALTHDRQSEGNGITGIKFATAAGDGFIIRGDNAALNMGAPGIEPNYVCLKLAPAGTPVDQKITGFGIIQQNTTATANIIGTSGGTEMRAPYDENANFKRYWQNPTFPFSSAVTPWWGNDPGVENIPLYPVWTLAPLGEIEQGPGEQYEYVFKWINVYRPIVWGE